MLITERNIFQSLSCVGELFVLLIAWHFTLVLRTAPLEQIHDCQEQEDENGDGKAKR
jgi:hypothetical protein